jgi:hypothetical protein
MMDDGPPPAPAGGWLLLRPAWLVFWLRLAARWPAALLAFCDRDELCDVM